MVNKECKNGGFYICHEYLSIFFLPKDKLALKLPFMDIFC